MDAIQLDAVCLSYQKGRRVLDNIQLNVRPGECFALIGANGAGKTSLLKSVLDFIAVDQGDIRLFGAPHGKPAARSRVVYLPERFHPAYYQTGDAFLSTMLGLHGVAHQPDVARSLAVELELDPEALALPARRYSKGMTQKLGLIYALLSNCDLMLLDEPLSGLDPLARHRVLNRLGQAREAGRTLFISTHLLDEVAPICDRIGILHAGRLRFVGSTEACCERYGGGSLEQAYLNCIDTLND